MSDHTDAVGVRRVAVSNGDSVTDQPFRRQ
jgi:hypothetical protein